MCKKLIYLMCFVLVLGLAGLASAATVWNPAANGIIPPATGDWGEAANWTNGIPDNPDTNKAVFSVSCPAPKLPISGFRAMVPMAVWFALLAVDPFHRRKLNGRLLDTMLPPI